MHTEITIHTLKEEPKANTTSNKIGMYHKNVMKKIFTKLKKY